MIVTINDVASIVDITKDNSVNAKLVAEFIKQGKMRMQIGELENKSMVVIKIENERTFIYLSELSTVELKQILSSNGFIII
ncbi:MAG: hypothetical protein RR357_04195 [Clostridia bacterium]